MVEETEAPEECMDTSNGAIDRAGDGCSWYSENPTFCGSFDTDAFNASEMCCACHPEDATIETEECTDTNNGATDSMG